MPVGLEPRAGRCRRTPLALDVVGPAAGALGAARRLGPPLPPEGQRGAHIFWYLLLIVQPCAGATLDTSAPAVQMKTADETKWDR